MYCEQGKGQMLMLTRDPGELKLLNMTNYKAILHCKGYSSREGGGAGTKVGSEGQQAENRYSICLHMLYCSCSIIENIQ